MEKMHGGIHDTSGFSWQRVQDDSQAVEAGVSRCHEVLLGDVTLKKNLANMEATQTRLLHCAFEQIKYIYFKDAFKVGPGTYIENAPIGKDVLGIGQSSSQSCCVFLQNEKKIP